MQAGGISVEFWPKLRGPLLVGVAYIAWHLIHLPERRQTTAATDPAPKPQPHQRPGGVPGGPVMLVVQACISYRLASCWRFQTAYC